MRLELTWLCELQRVRRNGTSQEEHLLVIGRGCAGGVNSSSLFWTCSLPFAVICEWFLCWKGAGVSCYYCGQRWEVESCSLETGIALVPWSTALNPDINQISRFHKPAWLSSSFKSTRDHKGPDLLQKKALWSRKQYGTWNNQKARLIGLFVFILERRMVGDWIHQRRKKT